MDDLKLPTIVDTIDEPNIPTYLTKSLVYNLLLQCFGNKSVVAEQLNIPIQALNAYIALNPELDERYTEYESRLLDLAEVRLYEKINEGDVRAIAYVLDRKGTSRGWIRPS